jgi:hypothetical protein
MTPRPAGRQGGGRGSQNDVFGAARTEDTPPARSAPNGGYRVSHDRGAVAIGNEA